VEIIGGISLIPSIFLHYYLYNPQ